MNKPLLSIPIKTLLVLILSFLSLAANAQFWSKEPPQLLPEEEAFQVIASVDNSGLLRVNWSVADDYYMYRDQFGIESATAGVTIGDITFPEGVVEDDPEFGEVVVYFYNVELPAQLSFAEDARPADGQLKLILKGQGCNKPVGVCYPPQTREYTVDISNVVAGATTSAALADTPTPTSTPQAAEKSFLGYVLSAFFAGILLSFTPCVLPMIPILAGVIAGQNQPSKMQAGWLAICYVAGTVVTYLIAGAVAGATGAQLQAYFQNVWVISVICGLLVLLAASLFGWFRIELPSAIQSKLSGSQVSTRSASFSSFSLGLISALVVGACVSPILILALGAAITQGDPVLGAAIMGSMALGMGLLLIAFGFGAGWILPKAGPWMTQIQVLFGFMVLGVAIYLLSGLSFIPSLYLWAALLLTAGFYCWQLGKDISLPLLQSFLRAVSAILIIWGGMALLGGSMQGKDILRPLDSLSFASNSTATVNGKSTLPFNVTTTLAEVQSLMQEAKEQQQPVLIDFYADWCLDCKRMHRTTFQSSTVQAALQNWQLIEIDVTNTSDASEEVKRHFQVFGPPATLFYRSNGQEQQELRQYGYIKEAAFLDMIAAVK
ncbi:MAG: protein-disulfide reductase DsbD [Pseudomonadota bacterium]